MNIKDKTAVVTGGTKGIGRAIAEALLHAGAQVCISARHEDDVENAVREVSAESEGRVAGGVCDVRDYEQVKAMLDHTVSEFGGVDVLVNNAGVGMFAPVEELSPEDFRSVLETNLFGVFYCCHE